MKAEGKMLKKENVALYVRNYALAVIFIFVCLVFAIASPTFLTMTNIIGVLRQVSVNGILAVGMMMVIITGGIDLSIGPLAATAGVVSALILENNENILALAILAGIISAAIVSMWTGMLVAKMKIAPFIASLSTMSIAKGVVLVIADGVPHTIKDKTYTNIGNGFLWDPAKTGGLSIPIPIIIFAVVAILVGVVLYKTRYGRHIYAVGGNEHAAIASGVNTTKVKFCTYVFNGVLCGIAGIVLAGRITSGQPTAATGYEMDAITAVIVGGTSMTGGVGRISGTIIGVLIIGVLNNGLVLMGVSSYYQQIIKGVIIAAAVLLDMKTKKN